MCQEIYSMMISGAIDDIAIEGKERLVPFETLKQSTVIYLRH
jgi:hypothetical protein